MKRRRYYIKRVRGAVRWRVWKRMKPYDYAWADVYGSYRDARIIRDALEKGEKHGA